MPTLTFNLDDEVTGSVTGSDEMDDIEICAEVTVDGYNIGSIDWTHTPEILDEVTVHVMTDFDLSPSDLDGTNEDRLQFAADMTAEVIKSITEQRDMHRTRLAREREESAQAKADQRAAEMKLAAVWPAVVEAFGACCVDAADEPAVAAEASIQIRRASAKVLDALRTLGLEPEPESKTDTES